MHEIAVRFVVSVWGLGVFSREFFVTLLIESELFFWVDEWCYCDVLVAFVVDMPDG